MRKRSHRKNVRSGCWAYSAAPRPEVQERLLEHIVGVEAALQAAVQAEADHAAQAVAVVVPDPPEDLQVGAAVADQFDRFEDAWSSPTRPRLDGFLDTVGEPERSWLLEELVALEVELRRAAGEQPTDAEYQQAYPSESDGRVIAAAFRRCADADAEGEPARPLPQVSATRRPGRSGSAASTLPPPP